MQAALPRRLTGFAALGLAACAAAGLVLGVTKAAPTATDYRTGEVGADGAPAAKPLTAGATAALDEAAIRKIAHEEAQAALAKPAKAADATTPSPKHTDPNAPAKLAKADDNAPAKADSVDAAPGDTPTAAPRHHRQPKPAGSDAPSAPAGSLVPPSPPAPPTPAQVPDQY